MVIISDLSTPLKVRTPVLTIGNFDGVHLGHQKIFRRVVAGAREVNGTPLAMTFVPHPVRVLAPERDLKLLTTDEDKADLISRSGIDILLAMPFSREFARTEPDDFIKEILVERLGVRWVIVGHSYAFGKSKKGGTALLRRQGAKFGFKVTVVRYAKILGDVVSSSRVRGLITRGRVAEAAMLLGREYHIDGVVVPGAGRGAMLLKTPTANIDSPNEVIPREGVYAVRVSFIDGLQTRGRSISAVIHGGVANIGKNPTFGSTKLSYEVHLFDYHDNIVGRALRVHFVERIREERKFPSVDALRRQITEDVAAARNILSARNNPLYS